MPDDGLGSDLNAGAQTFEGALSALIARIFPDVAEVVRLMRLSGGASRETWSFDVAHSGGVRPLVLRRSPKAMATPSSHPLWIEARIMERAEANGVPVPKVIYVLAPKDGLGDGFLMDRVPGETIPRKLLRDAAFAEVRPKLAYELGSILARIHAIESSGLEGLRPLAARTALHELYAAYKADGCPRPVFEFAFRKLTEAAPDEPRSFCLVHGDFRNGNLIVGPDGVRAVLDWELAHLGDPMEDLGWLCVNSWRFGVIDKAVGGFGHVDELIAGYRAGGGGEADPKAIHFWQALGTLRWGVICLGMLASYESGEERTIERAMIARRASETELDLLRILAPRRVPAGA